MAHTLLDNFRKIMGDKLNGWKDVQFCIVVSILI